MLRTDGRNHVPAEQEYGATTARRWRGFHRHAALSIAAYEKFTWLIRSPRSGIATARMFILGRMTPRLMAADRPYLGRGRTTWSRKHSSSPIRSSVTGTGRCFPCGNPPPATSTQRCGPFWKPTAGDHERIAGEVAPADQASKPFRIAIANARCKAIAAQHIATSPASCVGTSRPVPRISFSYLASTQEVSKKSKSPVKIVITNSSDDLQG